MGKSVMTITEVAAQQIAQRLAARGKPSAGIRVGVQAGGCSGFKYILEYADEVGEFDEVVEYAPAADQMPAVQNMGGMSEGAGSDGGDVHTVQPIRVLVDRKALLAVLGTEMDYIDEKFKKGFVFKNPNEKGRCGCGESFSV